MHTLHRHLPKKYAFAFALAVLAGLSFLYERNVDQVMPSDVAVFTALAASDPSSRTGYEMFLKVDTIDGDVADSKHRSEISVDSFAWSQLRGATATKPTMDGFRITMPVSSASAKLFLYGAGGTRIPRIVLSVRTTGAQQDFLKWIFTDARIIGYQTVGNTKGDGIEDQIILGFGKVETEYRRVMQDGTLGEAVRAGFDQRTGKTN